MVHCAKDDGQQCPCATYCWARFCLELSTWCPEQECPCSEDRKCKFSLTSPMHPLFIYFFTRMSPSFVSVLRQSCFYDGYSCCGGLQSINCYPPLSLLSVVHFRSAEILATAHSGHITELLHLPWAHSTAVGRLLLHVSSEHAGTAGRCA